MRNRTINDQGAMNLIEAVVERTAKDFMATEPQSDARKIIESEILSAHFETMTGLDGRIFLRDLQMRYEQKKRQKRKGK